MKGFIIAFIFLFVYLLFPQQVVATNLPTGLNWVGVNKFDLFWFYPGFNNYQKSRDTARQILNDLKTNEIQVVRFFVQGKGSVEYWKDYPQEHKQLFRQLIDDASAYNIKLVPVLVAPETFGGGYRAVTHLTSEENKNMKTFIRDIVSEYKDSKTILFWEITNELQNHVPTGEITLPQLNAFIKDTATFIRQIDSTHLVSTGHSVHPRGLSNYQALQNWYKATNPDPVGIVSMHIYPDHENRGFTLLQMIQAAKSVGKPLFIGETGDFINDPLAWKNPPNFLKRVLQTARSENAAFVAVWSWDVEKSNASGLLQQKAMSFSITKNTFVLDLIKQNNRQNKAGDFNADGKVNLADYTLVVSSFGTTYNIFDYNSLVANYER